MAKTLKEARPEPGGSWTVGFNDGTTQTIKADWIERVGDWVEFRSADGLLAITRKDATDCIVYTPPTD